MVKYRFKISKSFIPPAWYGRCIKRFNRYDSQLGKIFVIQLGHAGFVILALGWLPAASQQNKNMKKKLARLKNASESCWESINIIRGEKKSIFYDGDTMMVIFFIPKALEPIKELCLLGDWHVKSMWFLSEFDTPIGNYCNVYLSMTVWCKIIRIDFSH